MGIFDLQTIEITCPHCGHKIKQTLGWFKQQGHHCGGCGALLKPDELRLALKKIERRLDELRRRIGKFKL